MIHIGFKIGDFFSSSLFRIAVALFNSGSSTINLNQTQILSTEGIAISILAKDAFANGLFANSTFLANVNFDVIVKVFWF